MAGTAALVAEPEQTMIATVCGSFTSLLDTAASIGRLYSHC